MVFMDVSGVTNYLTNYNIKLNFQKSVSGVLPQVIEQDNYDSTNSNKVVYESLTPADKFQALNLKFETAKPSKYRNLYISVVADYRIGSAKYYIFYSSNCKWADSEFGNMQLKYMKDVFEAIFELLDKYKVDPEALNENLKTE